MKWEEGGHRVLAGLTFTDRCNKITCCTRHVHKERGGGERELNRAASPCSLLALDPGYSPVVESCCVGLKKLGQQSADVPV